MEICSQILGIPPSVLSFLVELVWARQLNMALRFSGKLDKNWRIGAMNMQTGKVPEMHLPRQNFAVFALQRRVFSRSNVGVIFIDKESMNYTPSEDPAMPVYSAVQ